MEDLNIKIYVYWEKVISDGEESDEFLFKR